MVASVCRVSCREWGPDFYKLTFQNPESKLEPERLTADLAEDAMRQTSSPDYVDLRGSILYFSSKELELESRVYYEIRVRPYKANVQGRFSPIVIAYPPSGGKFTYIRERSVVTNCQPFIMFPCGNFII